MKEKTFTQLQLWSAWIGNFFEHYDSALFGFLSPFLAPLFFPGHDPLIALMLTYAMIPLGMIARPFGAIVFGCIGDSYGRRQALFIALLGTAIASGFVAFSPTYAQIGLLAPLLFCCSRIAQNFFSSGENMGGAIFLLENSSAKAHDVLSGLYNAATIGGIIAASAGVSFLSQYGLIDDSWRGLYLLGCVTALCGCVIRRRLPEERVAQKLDRDRFSFVTFFRSVWEERQGFLLICFAAGFSYANYSVALVLMNGFIPLISEYTKEQMVFLNTILLVLDLILLPVFGWIAAKTSRERMMFLSSLGVVCTIVPLFYLLETPTLYGITLFRILLVLFGVAFFAPFHAWAQTLVSPKHRYSVISLGYAVGSQLLGGPTTVVSLWLYKETEMISSVSWYWLFLGIVTCILMYKRIGYRNISSQKSWDVA